MAIVTSFIMKAVPECIVLSSVATNTSKMVNMGLICLCRKLILCYASPSSSSTLFPSYFCTRSTHPFISFFFVFLLLPLFFFSLFLSSLQPNTPSSIHWWWERDSGGLYPSQKWWMDPVNHCKPEGFWITLIYVFYLWKNWVCHWTVNHPET